MSTSIFITKPEVRTMSLAIEGEGGLICHNFSEKSRRQIAEKQAMGVKAPKDKRNPDAEYQAAFYHLVGGGYGFPCSGFKQSAIRAAKLLDGITMTDARQMFFIEADERDTTGVDCVRIEGTPEMRTDVVRLPGRVADLRYRPEIRDWSCVLRISYDEQMISDEQIVNLFWRAGYQVGIGDWRPEKNGDFGRFTVSDQEALSLAVA